MNEWKYISSKLLGLVAPDGEVLEEIIGDYSGYIWVVSSTGKTHYGESAARAAAEKRIHTAIDALERLNRASENNGNRHD